jgi:hypothetical protein
VASAKSSAKSFSRGPVHRPANSSDVDLLCAFAPSGIGAQHRRIASRFEEEMLVVDVACAFEPRTQR